MNALRRSVLIVCSIGTLASLINCSTFLTPAILDPGEVALGVGLNLTNTVLAPNGALYARMGVAKRTEVGFKIEGPFALTMGADIKYQLLAEPILVAADLGLYVYLSESSGMVLDCSNPGGRCESSPATPYIVPGVVFGTEQLFGGVRILFGFPPRDAPLDVWPQASLGFATSGEKLKLIGAATIFLPIWGFGTLNDHILGQRWLGQAELGLQWHLKNRVWQPSGSTEG